MLWDENLLDVTNVVALTYSLSAMVRIRASDVCFKVTSVYGPTDSSCKDAFFAELISHKPLSGVAWLALGDFNQIYEAREKNNLNLNRRLMGRFRAAINRAGLRQLKSSNRKSTWSNERDNPTLVGIDKFFCNAPW